MVNNSGMGDEAKSKSKFDYCYTPGKKTGQYNGNIFFSFFFFFLDLNNSNAYFGSQYASPIYILYLYRIKETKITVYL